MLLSDKLFNHCYNLTALFYKLLGNVDRKTLQTILQISIRVSEHISCTVYMPLTFVRFRFYSRWLYLCMSRHSE